VVGQTLGVVERRWCRCWHGHEWNFAISSMGHGQDRLGAGIGSPLTTMV
jgi:hypothetical protein